MRPASEHFPAHLHSDVWASQGGDMAEPSVNVEYGSESIEIRFDDLLSLRRAIDGLLEVFGNEDDAK